MRQCDIDTREILGTGAATVLAHWHEYEADLGRLVKFIHDRIYSEKRVNGWTLEHNNRMSLERIVAFHCPELFNPSEIRRALETLGK